jgi:hypothetical protein
LSGYTITAPLASAQVDGAEPPVPAFTIAVTDVATLTLSLDSGQTSSLGAAYLGTPLPWRWSVWLQNDAERIELVRGEVVLHRA